MPVRRLRFLLTRRWLLLLLTVLLFAYACLLLGRWQWHRLESKKTGNAIIRANEKAAPRPVDQVLRPGVDPPDTAQYAVVSASGTYDVSHTIVVRYQTRDGNPGIDVVVPLVTGSGPPSSSCPAVGAGPGAPSRTPGRSRSRPCR